VEISGANPPVPLKLSLRRLFFLHHSLLAEILYRHAVHELGFYEWEDKESGDIDNREKFLAGMADLVRSC
jgi:hypothetical protein